MEYNNGADVASQRVEHVGAPSFKTLHRLFEVRTEPWRGINDFLQARAQGLFLFSTLTATNECSGSCQPATRISS